MAPVPPVTTATGTAGVSIPPALSFPDCLEKPQEWAFFHVLDEYTCPLPTIQPVYQSTIRLV
jgi:hypothetical protein